jgi:hypothetical protein
MASARKKSSSKNLSGRELSLRHRVFDAVVVRTGIAHLYPGKSRASRKNQFALCITNDEYPASLEVLKMYPLIKDAFADKHNLVRVIDESGEDYLYPAEYFIRMNVRGNLQKTLQAALSRKAA